jgi:hypothetical protein
MRDTFQDLLNYLHILIKLRVKIPFKDIKELRHYFEPTEDGELSPLDYIRELPKERRRGALLAGASVLRSAAMMSRESEEG